MIEDLTYDICERFFISWLKYRDDKYRKYDERSNVIKILSNMSIIDKDLSR